MKVHDDKICILGESWDLSKFQYHSNHEQKQGAMYTEKIACRIYLKKYS